MTFGNDLQDQIPTIVDYVTDGIQSLNQFRSFVRDRSQLERDYAQKLENIARKYKIATTKKQGEVPNADDNEWNDSTSTSMNAWYSLLEQTDKLAKSRYQLVEELNTMIIDSTKQTIARKDDAKKKHVAFYQKLKAERDKTYLEKDKSKLAFDDTCAEIEAIQHKMQKGSGDKDKLQRQLNQAVLECNNKKNTYLLTIATSNAERTKYYEVDVPAIGDHLQDLDASRVLAMRDLYGKYINVELQALAKAQNHFDVALTEVSKMDPEVDQNIFIRDHIGLGNSPTLDEQFAFLPWQPASPTQSNLPIDQDSQLVISDSSIIFLNNRLLKDRKKLDTIADDLSKRSMELSEQDEKMRAVADKASMEYDLAREQFVDISRQMTLLSTEKARVKSEVDVIIHCIGDDGLNAQAHDFKPSSFTIPTTCDYCKSTIWGLSKQGLSCKACGFNCHAKCEMKVAPNCSGVRGQINEQPSSSNVSLRSPSIPSEPLPSTSTVSIVSALPPAAAAAASASQTSPDTDHLTSLPVVALYDYEAQNEDELTIFEGDQLTKLEENDGWVKVRRGLSQGLVPANYVALADEQQEATSVPSNVTSPVNDKTPSPTQPQHLDTSAQQTPSPNEPSPSSAAASTVSPTAPDPDATDLDYVTAVYDFSAINPEEMDLREGDRILVTKRDDSGWWEGVLNGQQGIFPANYVE
ncbi:SH3-domain-containing protein [Hesseltinella vesiculosa]|uniref:SH3-domain-containing protein n=1 Tax=Hesseltinella vesiculosa TaxID=101127 RepID=A0A1X2GC24_9FUNG|nr:SH3-domain-containing protein [Hesseltinella vesiculosa]